MNLLIWDFMSCVAGSLKNGNGRIVRISITQNEDLMKISAKKGNAGKAQMFDKTLAAKAVPGGKKISIFFMSTIGPGEKNQGKNDRVKTEFSKFRI